MDATPRVNKAERKRRRIRKILIVCAVIVLIVLVAMILVRKKVQQTFASSESSVQTAEVTTGSITSTVSGSGSLASKDVEDIYVPDGVTIESVYVEAGDSVEEGDALASVDSASVLSALADTQSSLDTLDAQLTEVGEEAADSTITASVDGRVKAVFATEDASVSDVMYDSGALLILSLDGKMAVDLESTDYTVGDEVTVTASDGTEYTGTVATVTDSTTTVLITDNGPLYQDTVTVGEDSGTLYIHEPLKVTGYAGTVSSVKVSANESVSAGDTLLTLTDTSTGAKYKSLLEQREELEEMQQTLVQLYKDGVVKATVAGSIQSVSYDADSANSSSSQSTTATTTSTASGQSTAALLLTSSESASSQSATGSSSLSSSSQSATGSSSSTTSSSEGTLLLSIDPQKEMTLTISVDETDVLSLSVGQTATVSVDSIEDTTFDGTVTEIDTTATSSGGVTAYTATVTLERSDGMLSGMTATAAVTIEGVDNALLLPADAVKQTSSTAYVYTSYDEDNDELGDMVEVTTGLSNGSYIEITDGLSEGDTVYYTESEDSSGFGDFGGMSDFGGGTSGGDMPSGGGDLPSGGGDMSGGSMPSGGGGDMPSGQN